MSDSERLHKAIWELVDYMVPEMLEENRITLAQLVTGILRSGQVQFRKVAQKLKYRFKKTSLEDKFRRFVRNKNIDVKVEYLPFAQFIVSSLSGKQKPLVLLIDSSKVGGRCICLMVSVYYKGRALPLCWTVYKGRKGHSSIDTQLTLLKTAHTLVPDNVSVILLGDGEFDGANVVDWMDEVNWQYACRTALDTLVFYQGEWVALQNLPLAAKQEAFFTDVLFTQSGQVGPVNILAIWNEKEDCHWFIVTNFATQKEATKWYRKRFTVETLFSDVKGRGFNLDKTRLSIPERVSRLILATAIAYLFSIFLGVDLIHSGKLGELVRIDDSYYSLFQLGLIYLDHLLNECLPFPDLYLPPPDSFNYLSFV
jgi:hypothetical protein